MKSKIAVLLYAIISFYIFFNREEYRQIPFRSDPSGYYLYLPATFIYHDVEKLGFCPGVNKLYSLNRDYDFYGTTDQPGGKKLIKYAIGTSVFELPFFLIARLYCSIDRTCQDDGYSTPFTVAGYWGCFLWVSFGLYLLSLVLKKYFTDGVVAFTILCVAFGTNLYYYSSFDPAYSHPYSFVAVSLVLYFTERWFSTFKLKYMAWLGIALGLVIITRPVNIAVAIIPLLWQVYNFESLKARGRLFFQKKLQVAIAILLYLMVCFIQMGYWKAITGHWIYYSYVGEHFNFLKPMIWKGLFSFRKGWFVYTPIAFLAFTGFYFLWKKDKKLAVAPLVFFAVIIYIVFSWEQWWYGGGFGCRPLIDVLPIVALPLAAFIGYVFSIGKVTLKIAALAVIFFCIALNIFQTYQYSLAYIPWDRATGDYYWYIFGKTRFDPAKGEGFLLR